MAWCGSKGLYLENVKAKDSIWKTRNRNRAKELRRGPSPRTKRSGSTRIHSKTRNSQAENGERRHPKPKTHLFFPKIATSRSGITASIQSGFEIFSLLKKRDNYEHRAIEKKILRLYSVFLRVPGARVTRKTFRISVRAAPFLTPKALSGEMTVRSTRTRNRQGIEEETGVWRPEKSFRVPAPETGLVSTSTLARCGSREVR
ncbi:hypothetical protein NPIL_120581 [Nephila pilipes]|uniref:Uncharacterized protein n=1 Tax=Nephila pilipes TaxID=299642 RepID=A0A8X6MP76_NEPPI|nr:hypothetical protein NPIL_120581 [Nephila pilipes]